MNLHSIDPDVLLLLVQESVSRDGKPLAHDAPRLDAALAYPMTRASSGENDVASIAAAYAAGLLLYRPFGGSGAGSAAGSDTGAALLALELFLSLNGWELDCAREQALAEIRLLETQAIDEATLANWIRRHL